MPYLSPSQASSRCGLALKFQRLCTSHRYNEHAPGTEPECPLCGGWVKPPRGVSLLLGTAVHYGIETYLRSKMMVELEMSENDRIAEALEAASTKLEEEVYAGPDKIEYVRWDRPPRLKQNGEPYSDERNQIQGIGKADELAEQMVVGWIRQFGNIPVLDMERRVEVDLAEYGHPGWVMICRLDTITEDMGLLDYKSSKDGWHLDRPHEIDSKLDQFHLYLPAFQKLYGQLPEYMAVHVGRRGSSDWDIVPVAVDESLVALTMERVVSPTIRMIESDAFLPNRNGLVPHSEEFCDYWHWCPYGAAYRDVAHGLPRPLVPMLGVTPGQPELRLVAAASGGGEG